MIKDNQTKLTLTATADRSFGAASLADGQLELTLHRRLFPGDPEVSAYDFDQDGLGPVTRNKIVLSLTGEGETSDITRPLSQYLMMQPVLAFKKVADFKAYK